MTIEVHLPVDRNSKHEEVELCSPRRRVVPVVKIVATVLAAAIGVALGPC